MALDGIKPKSDKTSAPRPKTEWQEEPAYPTRYGAANQAGLGAISQATKQGLARLSALVTFLSRFAKYGLVIIAVLAVGLFGLNYYLDVSGKDNTEINLEGQSVAANGERIRFFITLTNLNKDKELKDISLTLRADEGTELADVKSLAVQQKHFDSLAAGASLKEEVIVVFWGKQGDKRNLEAVARYKLGSSTNLSEKSANFEITLSDQAAGLNLSLPQQVITDQEFNLSLDYKQNTRSVLNDSFLILEAPADYVFTRSEPEREKTQTALRWDLKDVLGEEDGRPAQEGRLAVTGKFAAAENQGRTFNAKLVTLVRNREVLLAETKEELVAISNPLLLQVQAGNDQNYTASLNKEIRYQINFKNNYDMDVKDVIISADLKDTWFRPDTLRIENGGFYDSKNKIITWNGGTTPQLLVLQRLESGSVSFSIKTQSDFSGDSKSNTVKLPVELTVANQPRDIGTPIQVNYTLTTKINGSLSFQPRVVFRDDTATGFLNNGFLPPKSNQLTQYSAYFTMLALGNDFSRITAKTILPANVKFEGKIKGDTENTDFVYNPRTGELQWTIENLAAFDSRQIVFQLNAVPSFDQIGKLIPILNTVTISGSDDFTKNSFSDQAAATMSDLPDDDSVDASTGRVTP